MLLLLDLLSTVCFAGVAASIAIRHKLNFACVPLSAMIASTGGGTTREILLGSNSLFWLESPAYIVAVMIAIIFAYFVRSGTGIPKYVSKPADSLATAVFVVVGITAAFGSNSNVLVCLLMGVLTGIGGGIIRQAIFDRRSFKVDFDQLFAAVYIALIGVILVFNKVTLLGTVLLLALVHLSLTTRRSGRVLLANLR